MVHQSYPSPFLVLWCGCTLSLGFQEALILPAPFRFVFDCFPLSLVFRMALPALSSGLVSVFAAGCKLFGLSLPYPFFKAPPMSFCRLHDELDTIFLCTVLGSFPPHFFNLKLLYAGMVFFLCSTPMREPESFYGEFRFFSRGPPLSTGFK